MIEERDKAAIAIGILEVFALLAAIYTGIMMWHAKGIAILSCAIHGGAIAIGFWALGAIVGLLAKIERNTRR